MRRKAAPALCSPPGGDARSGAGEGSRLAPPRAAAPARPRRPPPSLPRCQSRPPAGQRGTAGVRRLPAVAALVPRAAVRPTRGPSVYPSIHPSDHPCVGGGSCVCVTDSAARTARGSRPSQPSGATAARRGWGSPFSVPRSPPQWGRPQRPRCSSSSSLLAGQVFQIQERILCHVFVKQPGLYSLWADSGTVLIRIKNNI
ncbi:ataxin-2-like isoform X3 [Corapipo altera]|uniref:ataxin-2-like isoform X3 n=1 Tax=Corapipo altera TaxID=415028 RepID=UPI000FD62B99|nr:ataxin-2-like isoform X3 [Corapipo altera]